MASQANMPIGIAQISRVRHGMRIVFGLVFAFVCTAPLASAQKPVDITSLHIGGILLGMSQADARSLMIKPIRVDRLEDGYMRFVSTPQKLESYFRTDRKSTRLNSSH